MRHTPPSRRRTRHAAGFTLTEIMAVVVILGLLAALVFFVAQWAIDDARRAAFITDLRNMATAAEMYKTRHGVYPDGGESGELPEGMDEYISEKKFGRGTPIGGFWDFQSDSSAGFSAGVGVHFADDEWAESEDVEQYTIFPHVQDIDNAIDDGNLNTGRFRRDGNNRFYLVLAN